MSTTLIHSCDVVVTMDDTDGEIPGGSILIEDGVITWIGTGTPPTTDVTERIDGAGTVAVPGLVNTHHHLFQSLTRARAQECDIFGWLVELYRTWRHLDEEWMYVAARLGLAELLLSGCTLTTDHHYLFPTGRVGLLEAEINAARELGIRFHPNRGSMDLGERDGGLPPQEICEDRDEVLADTERAIARHHDPSPGSMLQISVGPCYPLTNTPELMTESVALARRAGVRLHTHIAEGRNENKAMRERFGRSSMELLEDYGFLGPDSWLAHCVQLDEREIATLARTGTGVATCPSSNLRLGSGIAPVRAMLDLGVPVGLGVDGAASNDSSNLALEARQLMLASRAGGVEAALTAREALRVATRGGAAVLGRDDLGRLEVGRRGDVVLFDVTTLDMAGAAADPVAGLLFCGARRARDVLVEGRHVVVGGQLARADEREIAAVARRTSTRIRNAV